MAAKLKKGDTVVVLTGKDKGKKGEISSVNPTDEQGRCRRAERRHPPHQAVGQHARAAVMPKAMPIDLSNLAIVDKNGKATRVGFRMEGDKKVRFAKTTGEAI